MIFMELFSRLPLDSIIGHLSLYSKQNVMFAHRVGFSFDYHSEYLGHLSNFTQVDDLKHSFKPVN